MKYCSFVAMWNEICPHSRQRIFHICGANISQHSYFTCPQGQISLKKAHFCLVDKCVLFLGCGGGIFHCPPPNLSRCAAQSQIASSTPWFGGFGCAKTLHRSLFACLPTPSAACGCRRSRNGAKPAPQPTQKGHPSVSFALCCTALIDATLKKSIKSRVFELLRRFQVRP